MLFAYHAVSVPGNGHIRTERPCQDASGVWCDFRPCLIVCDGRAVQVAPIMAQGRQWRLSARNARYWKICFPPFLTEKNGTTAAGTVFVI